MVKRNGIWVLMPQRYANQSVWYAEAEVYLGDHMLQKFSGDAIVALVPPSDIYIADGDVFEDGYPVRLPKPVADGFKAVGVPVSEDGILKVKDAEMAIRLKEILGDVATLKPVGVSENFLSPENFTPHKPMAFVGSEDGVYLLEYDGSPLVEGIGYFRYVDGRRSLPLVVAVSAPSAPHTLDLDEGYLWDGCRWWAIRLIPC